MTARLSVRVKPRGGRDAIEGFSGDGALHIRVAAVPEDGRANVAVVRVLARALGVSPADVSIVTGGSSRRKVVEIDGLTLAELREKLAAHLDP